MRDPSTPEGAASRAMSHRSVQQHYDTMLARVYPWMLGDLDAARAAAGEDVAHLPARRAGAVAIDLGAGLGLHAQELARAGHDTVWMVDTSTHLLALATEHVTSGTAHEVLGDLTDFRELVAPDEVDTIVCMGDTLTHLADHDQVRALLGDVARSLGPDGVFLSTFRDYTHELRGTDRFIPVRADDARTLTAFLEFTATHVRVHDLLWERGDEGWALQTSSYAKVRLDPAWVADALRDLGLSVDLTDDRGGLTRVTARR